MVEGYAFDRHAGVADRGAGRARIRAPSLAVPWPPDPPPPVFLPRRKLRRIIPIRPWPFALEKKKSFPTGEAMNESRSADPSTPGSGRELLIVSTFDASSLSASSTRECGACGSSSMSPGRRSRRPPPHPELPDPGFVERRLDRPPLRPSTTISLIPFWSSSSIALVGGVG